MRWERWRGRWGGATPVIECLAWLAARRDPNQHVQAYLVRVVDDLVLNDYTSPNGDANHHESYGYLRTPEMSDLIGAFLSL